MSGGSNHTHSYVQQLSQEQIDIVNGLADAASALSVIGSTFILFSYFYFKRLRTFAFTLVAMLSFTDVCNQVFDFVQPSATAMHDMMEGAPVTPACYIQAIGDSFFELASVLWTTAIAALLYMSVYWRMSAEDVSRRWPWFCVWCYGLPAVLTLIPGVDKAYGPAGSWCWIIESKPHWRYIQFYAPLWLAVLFNTVVYVRVLRLLRRVTASGPKDETKERIQALVRRLQMYPFILVIVWLFASINRVYESASGGKQVFALFLLQRVFSSLQGFLNAFAYGLSGGVREAIAQAISPYCPCCARGTMEDQLIRGRQTSANAAAGIDLQGMSDRQITTEVDDDDDDTHVRVPPTPHGALAIASAPRPITGSHASPGISIVSTSLPASSMMSRSVPPASSVPLAASVPPSSMVRSPAPTPSDGRADRVAIMQHQQ